MFSNTTNLVSAFVTGLAAGAAAMALWWSRSTRPRKCIPCECATAKDNLDESTD
jgi:hypothetical protein